MGKFNDVFKMLLSAHKEYNALLEYEARLKEDEWFEIDDQVFSFKRKITCWLKNTEEGSKSKGSSRSSRSLASKTSKASKDIKGIKIFKRLILGC